MFVSIHLMTCTFDNASIHLMTCRHIWQCLCFTSWHVWHYVYDSVCVHPFHDNTVHYYYWLCVCPAITWPADFWQCVHPSHDLHTFDSICVHLMSCRHFWQCLCPFILWLADTFDNVCVHPSYDLQTFLTVFLCPSILWPADIFDCVFVSIHLMMCRQFWQWALLSLDNTNSLFSISTNCFQGTIWYWCHYFVFQAPCQKHSPHVVPKFGDARESSRAVLDKKESKKIADRRARNKLTILCGWQDIKIQLLTKRHNFVPAQFKAEEASTYCYEPVTKGRDLKWDTLPQNQTPSKLFSVLPVESGMFQVTISIIKKWLWSKCVLYGIKTGVRSGVDVCNNGHSECHNNTEKNHLYAILMLLVHLSSC